jgi:hypothetical protein
VLLQKNKGEIMNCECSVCKGRKVNSGGLEVFSNEVMPFVHKMLGTNSNKPLPLKYLGWVFHLSCYSQAIYHDRIHGNKGRRYYTESKWTLKYKDKLNERFKEVIIYDVKEINEDDSFQEVCEFNAEKIN